MKPLYLPAIAGKFGEWQYFQLVMKVEDIVAFDYFNDESIKYRVKTVEEVEEIFSEKITDMLQRAFEMNRLEPIKNYLVKQHDKYLNNLTLAIYGGNPEWLTIGIRNYDKISVDEDIMESVGKSLGIISLTGDETIFVLDGQHRVKALRKAIETDKTLLKEDVSVTIIAHIPTEEGKQKTRRLFTTVNRYAKPVSLGETILLDEDDMSAIITRRLITDHKIIGYRKSIALNKTANLDLKKDQDKFSTTICLYRTVEKILEDDNKKIYPTYHGPKKNMVRVRPEDSVIDSYTKIIFEKWNLFFSLFPKAKDYIFNPLNNRKVIGDLFYLRPVGQQVIFSIFKDLN